MTIHNLPKWNLTEIYESINDPKIDKDINKIKKLISIFEKKWKGKIKKLSALQVNSKQGLCCVIKRKLLAQTLFA